MAVPQAWDLEVDFIAVGSGLAGISAAIAAHDRGKRVVVLEKAPKLGGVCAYSGGEVFVPCNHKMAATAEPDVAENAKAYFDFLAAGFAEEKLAQILFDKGKEAAEYMEEKAGVAWKIIPDFPDYHYPHAAGTVARGRYLEVDLFPGASLGPWQKKTYLSPHGPPGVTHDDFLGWGGLAAIATWDYALMGKRLSEDMRGMGPGMMGYFIKAAMIDRSIPAFVDCAVRELIAENGRVVGVRAEREGKDFYVAAKDGVLLAIGGYDWNEKLAKSFEGLPEWKSMVQPSVEGDNIMLGCELGAALAAVPNYNLGMFFGYRISGEEHEGKPLYRASWEGGYPHAIWVNRAGKRFGDESFYRDYLPRCRQWDGVKQEQPNYPPYLIFDQNYRDKYAFATFLPGMDIPESTLARDDTPQGLAEKLGVDSAGLLSTLESFNRFADGEVDLEFGRGTYPWAAMMTGDKRRKNPNMGPLNKPPYYGIKLTPVGVGINAVGLRTNETGQVMHVRERPIPGLYAAGNSAAALDTGAGYQSGLSNLRGMTWGYIIGRSV
jgi:3-oxosteroid 1-dehydrogenase